LAADPNPTFAPIALTKAALDAFGDRRIATDGLTLGNDEEEKSQVRIVLPGERVERVVEPLARFVHDDDRDDWRCRWGLRFHDGARLVLGPERWARVVHAARAVGQPIEETNI
jgi:hypothetical protein